jgi:hypothetical protein
LPNRTKASCSSNPPAQPTARAMWATIWPRTTVASVGMETNQAMNTERFWIGFEVAACRRRARQNEVMVRARSDLRIRVIVLFGRISKSRLRMQDQSPEMPRGAANSRAGLQKTTCKRSSAGTSGFAAGRRTAATDPASASPGHLIVGFAMSLADRGAGSLREIQTKSGRESPRARPAIARQHPNISSDEAHIWHT